MLLLNQSAMTHRPLLLLYVLGFLVLFTGCNDDDGVICNDCRGEYLTRVTWTLTPDDNSNETVVFSYVDVDGEGRNDPGQTISGVLRANANYEALLVFANEVESLNPEIIEEGDEHQVFYVVGGDLNLTPVYNDIDIDGNPIGLRTTVTTGNAASGTFQIVLRHEPVKGTMATIDQPMAAGGETDIEITFNASIQ